MTINYVTLKSGKNFILFIKSIVHCQNAAPSYPIYEDESKDGVMMDIGVYLYLHIYMNIKKKHIFFSFILFYGKVYKIKDFSIKNKTKKSQKKVY